MVGPTNGNRQYNNKVPVPKPTSTEKHKVASDDVDGCDAAASKQQPRQPTLDTGQHPPPAQSTSSSTNKSTHNSSGLVPVEPKRQSSSSLPQSQPVAPNAASKQPKAVLTSNPAPQMVTPLLSSPVAPDLSPKDIPVAHKPKDGGSKDHPVKEPTPPPSAKHKPPVKDVLPPSSQPMSQFVKHKPPSTRDQHTSRHVESSSQPSAAKDKQSPSQPNPAASSFAQKHSMSPLVSPSSVTKTVSPSSLNKAVIQASPSSQNKDVAQVSPPLITKTVSPSFVSKTNITLSPRPTTPPKPSSGLPNGVITPPHSKPLIAASATSQPKATSSSEKSLKLHMPDEVTFYFVFKVLKVFLSCTHIWACC